MRLTTVLAFLLAFFVSTAIGHDLTDEEIKKIEGGEIVTRIHRATGSGVLDAQAYGIMEATVEQSFRVIGDRNRFKEFMPATLESIVLKSDSRDAVLNIDPKSTADEVDAMMRKLAADYPSPSMATEKVTVLLFYTRVDIPWPADDKWYILGVTVSHVEHRSAWEMINGNMKENRGSWKMSSYGDGTRTLVEYEVHTDPGGNLPDFIQSTATKITLPNVIKSVKKRAAEYEYPETAKPVKKSR
jgi:ribosome-associated toxin RatA of RatAB toxin-antitoxin module